MITRVVPVDGDEWGLDPSMNNRYRKIVTIYGKSTDAKPIEGMRNADRFYEMDTQKVYMFDEDNKEWLAQ